MEDWIKWMAGLSVVLTIITLFMRAGVAHKLGLPASGGSALAGGGCGFLTLFLFAWLGVWAAENGHRIIAGIVAALFTANVVLGGLGLLALSVMSGSAPDAVTNPTGNTAIVSPAQSEGDATSTTSASKPASTQSQASSSASNLRSSEAPSRNLSTPSSRVGGGAAVMSADASATDNPALDAVAASKKQTLDAAARAITADVRAFGKLVTTPPAADRKLIEERRAACEAIAKKIADVSAKLRATPDLYVQALKDAGASETDALARKARIASQWNFSTRKLAAEELGEMSALAIRECDTLLANLGSWKLEGGSIVGKDADHTTQLNDARFFLKAKLNQLETRIVQLRGE